MMGKVGFYLLGLVGFLTFTMELPLQNERKERTDIMSIHQKEYYAHLKEAIFKNPPPFRVELKEKKGLTYKYYGFLPYWVSTSTYSNFRFELLTHIAYFSVAINTDGSLGAIPNSSNFTDIMNLAHPRGVRVHMTFTLFGSTSVSSFLNNPTARLNAINNISQFISNYNLDGVNIDFEYVTSTVRDSFSKFINDLYYELKNHPEGRKELYIAIPPVPSWYPGYDYSYLASHSDGLFIMAYDYHYAGDNDAGPIAPTINSSFWGYYAVNTSISDILGTGAPSDKLILGIPYYGYDWPTESSSMGSATRGSGSAVVFYNAKANSSSYGRLWDNYSLTPWYTYYVSGDGWHQCWYEDSVSMGSKLDLMINNGLQGAGCWALGYDDGEDDLWNIIRSKLWLEPPQRHFVVKVNCSTLNIREGPGTDYPVMAVAYNGDKFVAFQYEGHWYKVYFPSASGFYYGYMWGGDGVNYQYLTGSTGDSTIRITASLLNVREGPSTSYAVITQFANGQVFVLDSTAGSWGRVYLPYINSYTRGWCYYGTYSVVHYALENNNTYDCEIINVTVPDTVVGGDTFTVSVYVKNTGWGPFDESVYLKSSPPSPFVDTSWNSDTLCPTSGYNGLPNQSFYRYALMRAPWVSDTAMITDTFYFYRSSVAKGSTFGAAVVVQTVVVPKNLSVRREQNTPQDEGLRVNLPGTIFTGELEFEVKALQGISVKIFDLAGRKVFEKNGMQFLHFRFGKNLPEGVYFYYIKSGREVKRGKVIKVR